ncbi:unnamed protein product [Trichobilharzia regenti]|nr:unnamed protein product [Trichobilharzia regenti]
MVIFGQIQILKRLKKEENLPVESDALSRNIKPWHLDFTNPLIRSQMQLYSAWYHFNILPLEQNPSSRVTSPGTFNNDKELLQSAFVMSLTPKEYTELMNQFKTFESVTNHWKKDTKTDTVKMINFDWIDCNEKKKEDVKADKPKMCMNGWLIPQGYLSEKSQHSNSDKIKPPLEEEVALRNISVPLNTETLQNELKESRCLHYPGILKLLDEARLYKALYIHLISLSSDENYAAKPAFYFDTNFTTVSRQKFLFRFVKQQIQLLQSYTDNLQEIMIRFEMLNFCLEVNQLKRATHQALSILDILFDQKTTIENFDASLSYNMNDCIGNDDMENTSILHASLPCATSDFTYCYKHIPSQSLKILNLQKILTEYCFSPNIVIKVMGETIKHLVDYENYIQAFPIIYLMYYISKYLLQDLQLEIKSKLLRIKCLIGIGALKQALTEICAILQEQSDDSNTQECQISLINFDDAKMQDVS